MIYNLADKVQLKAARSRISYLARKGRMVTVTEKKPQRTLAQNNYLHLILGAFGLHFGYTIEEAKLIYKEINRGYYYYKKKDRTFVKSSADLTKEEMAATIDNFIVAAMMQDCELPKSEDHNRLMFIENEMERNKRHLYGTKN